MKKFSLKTLVVAIILSLSGVYVGNGQTDAAARNFKDLPTTHWAYSAIMQGVEKGYIKGDAKGTFRPADSVTVAEFIKMTFMSLTDHSAGFVWWGENYLDMVPDYNESQLNAGTTSFDQGKPWYQNYVDTAQNLGIIANEYVGRYDEPLTRERAAKILTKLDFYFHGTLDEAYARKIAAKVFKDYNRTDIYYQEYVGGVAIRGIMNGSTNGYFNPKASITRAEVAKICMVLSDTNRKMANINPDVPYALVPSPGYGQMALVFANTEVKQVYETMSSRQSQYSGATSSYIGILTYYENDELKQQGYKIMFEGGFATNQTYVPDMNLTFDGNVYNMSVGTKSGRFERASNELKQFLSLIFKTNADAVYKEIKSAVETARRSNVSVDKTVGGRQLVISSSDQSIGIAISAYADKK